VSVTIQIKPQEGIAIKDPQDTDLGRRILKEGIRLLDQVGLEDFTFRKLAKQIKSTEASIYRYFENKHMFLIYLLNLYWEWVRYRIDLNTRNLVSPDEKLMVVVKTLVDTMRVTGPLPYTDRDALHRIVIAEGTKAYHIKAVDEENKKGFFLTYKELCKKVADIALEVNPKTKFPKALASTLLEMANDQIYFAEHLPSLTDANKGDHLEDEIERVLIHFVRSWINSAESR
jgi:AcrR family transcriptional regulator